LSPVAIVVVVVVVVVTHRHHHPSPSSLSSYPVVPSSVAPSPSLLSSSVAPSPSTFASRCPIHHLRRSRRWLVVAFSARPAAYQLNHQAENDFMFSLLDLF
jgi:hypothetical protein